MATDQEVARRILGIQEAEAAGQLDAETARQLLQEEQPLQAAEMTVAQAPPEALQANVPESLAATPPAVVIPQVDPMLARAANVAQAQEQQQAQLADVPTAGSGMPQQLYGNVGQPTMEQMPVEEVVEPAQAVPQQEISTAPSLEQTQAAEQGIVKPVQEAIAEHRATKSAQKDLQAEFAKQQQEYQQQQEQIQAEILRKDDFVRQKSLPEIMQRGSFGEKLTATIALMLGGIGQGLSGSKSNPVLDFIDKQVEVQAQKDKLSQETKLALKKQLMDIAQLKMQNIANQSSDLFHKQSLEQEAAKIAIMRQNVEGDQAIKAAELFGKQNSAAVARQAESGAAITDLSVLSEDQRKRVIRLPDGTHRLATVGPDQVDAFAKSRAELEPGIAGVDRIKALSQDFNRVTDLKKRAQIGSEIKALTGTLRVPFTGPGALTEREYDRLLSIVGDPNALIAIPSLEMAKLNQVRTKLNADLSAGFKRVGVDLPQTRKEQLIEKFSK